ncbi:hypothetical protein ASPBRDRAFT_134961 [Aspergillus brasiliensis CBS 101740]|uniref:Uncharacterized protein n=1 Tax=Aspergillus brasiliensis (strain CBS 101740 / IMI 381727 / IBT 21946) TaxID=767769 RepID=A0A1L9U7K4_ASPBC|nr:hypothetical protein ASPBRDRAFT_134961 [Aspergillus brasiliensis CBS 101740]
MSRSTAEAAVKRNFQQACTNGNMRGVRRALASGQLSARDLDLGLRHATSEAHLDIIIALLDIGIPMSPLAIGYLTGKRGRQDPRVIRLYFDRGLKPRKCTTSAGEPLLRRFFYADCARELLERGVDPNRCGPRKITPLASALNKVNEDGGATFDLLVEYGAKVDSSLWFHALAWPTDTGIKARFLLSKGLDPTTATSEKWGTPLHAAVRFADMEVIQLLLDVGADPRARSYCKNFNSLTPVDVAKWKKRASHEPSVKSMYRSVIELLESASIRSSPLRTGVSEVSNTGHDSETPAANETKTNERHGILGNDLSDSAVRDLNLEAERATNKQNTKKREITREGSVSSRTRSRTKTVS